MTKTQWYIGAPNGVILCVDAIHGGEPTGRLFHSYRTDAIRVQHRQNSSWQGRITWMEQDKTISFRSVWEMVKLIENAVDTVSEEDKEEMPSW